jgi:hypothetical protein
MAADTLDLLMRQASTLTVDEQLRLAAYLVEQARKDYSATPRRKWAEIEGIAPYPLVGENAQDWVTRTRHESDEQREQQWRRSQ